MTLPPLAVSCSIQELLDDVPTILWAEYLLDLGAPYVSVENAKAFYNENMFIVMDGKRITKEYLELKDALVEYSSEL